MARFHRAYLVAKKASLVEDRQCYLLFLSVWGYMVNDTKWGKPGLTPLPGKNIIYIQDTRIFIYRRVLEQEH